LEQPKNGETLRILTSVLRSPQRAIPAAARDF